QPTIATHLGYKDASTSRRLEKFMRDLYSHMRCIFLTTRTLEERLALLPRPSRLPDFSRFLPAAFKRPPPQTLDGFRFEEGQIHPSNRNPSMVCGGGLLNAA